MICTSFILLVYISLFFTLRYVAFEIKKKVKIIFKINILKDFGVQETQSLKNT